MKPSNNNSSKRGSGYACDFQKSRLCTVKEKARRFRQEQKRGQEQYQNRQERRRWAAIKGILIHLAELAFLNLMLFLDCPWLYIVCMALIFALCHNVPEDYEQQ